MKNNSLSNFKIGRLYYHSDVVNSEFETNLDLNDDTIVFSYTDTTPDFYYTWTLNTSKCFYKGGIYIIMTRIYSSVFSCFAFSAKQNEGGFILKTDSYICGLFEEKVGTVKTPGFHEILRVYDFKETKFPETVKKYTDCIKAAHAQGNDVFQTNIFQTY